MRSGKKDKTTRRPTRSQKELDTPTIDNEDKNNNDVEEFVPSCTNCFYCARVIKAGNSLLCACTNGQRELEARFFDFKWWVLYQSHARCWKIDPKKREKQFEPEMLTPEAEVVVESLRDEIISSSSKREALQTLEKYRKMPPARKDKKPKKPRVSKKAVSLRGCQNCYYCVTERSLSGSSWCHCSNPGRSIEANPGTPWVKSRLNLPCWKARQD
jgi:hypothetical protein